MLPLGQHAHGIDDGVHEDRRNNAAALTVDPCQDQSCGNILQKCQGQVQRAVHTHETYDMDGCKNHGGKDVGHGVALGIQRTEDQTCF